MFDILVISNIENLYIYIYIYIYSYMSAIYFRSSIDG